ncbi:protein maelstrom homolog [Mizuhopecten yessoensis]|uniref:Protein maelstrom-like n=1 Tax=Mizuhopecten yessoensis TaxID=6573 RepID=A0A210QDH1_MIZYE|nr:protein maelstrom homolog [Mizuhopecten yessoensis]OWF46797.1 Protein maelstrom-like [Mizuhopecten yessoensis]
MPKKPVRNAFYFFMCEIEPALRREGRILNGMQDVVPIAHPRWKALPDKEKQRFERMAKEYKGQRRGVEGNNVRMDNTGNIIAHRVDPRAEREKKRAREIKTVRETFPAGKAVAEENFYFVNFQTLCKTVDGEYLPAEVAVIEYNIRKGIQRVFHKFIEPGRIPTGYRYECQQKSTDYHQIPVSGFDQADDNYRGIWIQLENFVNPNGDKPEYPPMYCLGDDCEEMAYCLEWVLGGAALGVPNRLKKVYELEGLVVELFAHIGPAPSKSSVIDMLTSSTWDFEPNTKCAFHEELECKYCSIGILKRYAFAISDSLCQKYDVNLTKNHIPIRNNVNTGCTVLPPSSMRIQSRQGNAPPPRQAGGASYKPPQTRGGTPQMFGSQQPPGKQKVAASYGVDDDDDTDDSDDDIGYQSLRRPNMPAPGSAGRMAAAPVRPAWSANNSTAPTQPAWSASAPMARPVVPPSQITQNYPNLGQTGPRLPMGRGYMPASVDFPSLGRGNTNTAMAGIGRGVPKNLPDNEIPKKFAGRQGAPGPQIAPPPPSSWHAAISDVTPPSQSGASAMNRTPQASQGPPPGFSAINDSSPPEATPAPRLQTDGYRPALPNGGESGDSIVDMMRRQGRGILGYTVNNVPKGRGYAPPGMIAMQQNMGALSINSK